MKIGTNLENRRVFLRSHKRTRLSWHWGEDCHLPLSFGWPCNHRLNDDERLILVYSPLGDRWTPTNHTHNDRIGRLLTHWRISVAVAWRHQSAEHPTPRADPRDQRSRTAKKSISDYSPNRRKWHISLQYAFNGGIECEHWKGFFSYHFNENYTLQLLEVPCLWAPKFK